MAICIHVFSRPQRSYPENQITLCTCKYLYNQKRKIDDNFPLDIHIQYNKYVLPFLGLLQKNHLQLCSLQHNFPHKPYKVIKQNILIIQILSLSVSLSLSLSVCLSLFFLSCVDLYFII